MAFNLSPQQLALMMGGLNMMAASRGGSPDLTKGGMGYALQQGLQGGLQGYQLGNQMQQQDQKQKMVDDMLMKLNLDPTAQQSTGVLRPGVQGSALSNLSPEQKEMAKMAIMSGDWKSVTEMMGQGKSPLEFKDVQSLRKEYRDNPMVKSMPEVVNAYSQLDKLGSTGSSAGDLAMVVKFMKTLDPGSVVREGEVYMAQSTGGLIDRIGAYLGSLQGGRQLTDDQRYDIVQTARKLVEQQAQQAEGVRKYYSDLAGISRVDPYQVTGNGFGLPEMMTRKPEKEEKQEITGPAQIINGRKYIKQNGQWVEIDG